MPDPLADLQAVMENNMRPGTADSNVNVFEIEVPVTYGLLSRIRQEIRRLRVPEAQNGDPLAGTDTYDVLASFTPDDLAIKCRMWGKLEDHELVMMPDNRVRVQQLLRAAADRLEANEIELKTLRGIAGGVSDLPGFANVRDVIRKRRAEIDAASRSEVKAALVGMVKSTTVDGTGC